jgi:hypothetical protein
MWLEARWSSSAAQDPAIVNDVLHGLDSEFAMLSAVDGRPSISPEQLLRASWSQAFSTPSERVKPFLQLHKRF